MAEAQPFTIRADGGRTTVRVTEGIWVVALQGAAAAGRPDADRSLLARAGLLLCAAVPAGMLAQALDQAARPSGWAGKTADDTR